MLTSRRGSTGMEQSLQRSLWHAKDPPSGMLQEIHASDPHWTSCPRRFYDGRLAKSLRNIFLGHESLFLARGGDLRPDVAASCKSIREFDDAITRVTFGMPVAHH